MTFKTTKPECDTSFLSFHKDGVTCVRLGISPSARTTLATFEFLRAAQIPPFP